jgi:ABC-type lipoprotein release transport system permease subunit
MLVLEKKDNLLTVRALGASKKQIANIFFYEGLLINFSGLVIGLRTWIRNLLSTTAVRIHHAG